VEATDLCLEQADVLVCRQAGYPVGVLKVRSHFEAVLPDGSGGAEYADIFHLSQKNNMPRNKRAISIFKLKKYSKENKLRLKWPNRGI
jgi:hypothetical protein